MFQNYLKITLRNLRKNPGYSLLNIFGLAIGMACCLVMLLYVRSEISYDHFHENGDRIFRLGLSMREGDEVRMSARSTVPMGPALDKDYPEIEKVVRFWRAFNPVLGYQDSYFREDQKMYFVDPGVFEMLSFVLIKGDPGSALELPNSVVITQSMATKYFGSDDPMGQVLQFSGYPADEMELIVTGIMQDLPTNTHFDFELLASLEGVKTEAENWGSWKPIWTYVMLEEHVSRQQLESKLPDFIERYVNPENTEMRLTLEPLSALHLYSEFAGGFKTPGNINYIYIFSAIGFFILLIACINFMNLATARSMGRAREIGLRKVLGAFRNQLIKQFIGEAVLLSALSMVLAVGMIELLLPLFNTTFNYDLNIEYLTDWSILAILVTFVPIVGLIAGSYPAFFLSRFRPVKALGGNLISGRGAMRIRKALVIFQFSISIALILATILVYRQLDFILSKDLGFDKEQVVVVPYIENGEVLIDDLSRNPMVLQSAASQRVPINLKNSDGRQVLPEGFEQSIGVESYIIDERFLETYRIELIAGKNLSNLPGIAKDEFLINETAAKAFGWNPPAVALGKRLEWSGDKVGSVVGVVKDFHLASLHEEIEPLVLHTIPDDNYWKTFISVRIAGYDIPGTLKFIENAWRGAASGDAYEYFFIDDSLEQLHHKDRTFGDIFNYFAALAIVIACLGLFGLASYTAEQRTKEIGVRKVLGAGVVHIVIMLSRDLANLVIVANIVAWPVTWLVMDNWLQDFAYRANVSFWVFVLAGALALAIALLTISGQALRAASRNPVDALRYE